MGRVVKSAEERRTEILETAEKMFKEKGYAATSVDAIIKKIGVAKGTFYYYYSSKEAVLKAVVKRKLKNITEAVRQVAEAPDLDALTKMRLLLAGGQIGDEDESETAAYLHLPENRELHEEINVQTVIQLSPLFAKILEQGNREGVFQVEKPLETFRFLLTGAQFLLDGGLFELSPEDEKAQRRVLQLITEKVLGASEGAFNFLIES